MIKDYNMLCNLRETADLLANANGSSKDGGQLGKNEVPIFFAICIEEMHEHFEPSRRGA